MRGKTTGQQMMLMTLSPCDFVPKEHPLRRIKALTDQALGDLSRQLDAMYSETGRPSIPPERLLKACLLIALYTLRSERMLCEQLQYNFLFRWFLDMEHNEEVFDSSVFAKNKDRLLQHDMARTFFGQILKQAGEAKLLSDEHFTVDGTLIEAWASQKSFKPRDRQGGDNPPAGRNDAADFHGEARTNQTHVSTTDPEARLARKSMGKEARLSFAAHALMENRSGLCMDLTVSQATGTAEREEAVAMLEKQPHARTVGADKRFDCRAFVESVRRMGVVPHVAAKTKFSAIDARTTRHKTYSISQRCRKRVEEIFGWMKTIGGFRKTRYRGVERTELCALFTGAAYNLIRMARLLSPA